MNTSIKRHRGILSGVLFVLLALTGQHGHAHPGHADPVTISRSSGVYLEKLLPHYLKVQKALAQGVFTEETQGAADAIQRLTKEAGAKEKDPSGRKMFGAVSKAAAAIGAADGIDAAREAFAALNDELLPFFDSWPSHLLAHDLVLYTCDDTEQWWLQANGDKVADPYRGASVRCGKLVEKER
jgi:hypothetical protein